MTRLCLRAASTIVPALGTHSDSGFSHVDVLAGLAGVDGLQGVPVVRRADDDGVDVLAVEQLAVVVCTCGGLPPIFLAAKSR